MPNHNNSENALSSKDSLGMSVVYVGNKFYYVNINNLLKWFPLQAQISIVVYVK
jgi:RNA recognition motif-containing protein